MDYDFESGSGFGLEGEERLRNDPEVVVAEMLREFPNVSDDLKQLLQMIDDGQVVDIKGISEKSLIKHLKKLFVSLNLNESGDKVFLLPPRFRPTLEVVEPLIQAHVESKEQLPDHLIPSQRDDMSASRRRMIGPEMPSPKCFQSNKLIKHKLNSGNFEAYPTALIVETEFANEVESFEEVTRIMGVEKDSPYDVVGVNQKMSCSNPQAHQAFIKLNKAFKELQDPEKRKVLDDKIKLQEEHEQFKVELQAIREAAEWRRKQGIAMEGDDEILAQMEVNVPPKRDEWITTLPPESRPGMAMHSTKFRKSSKEGRGDTSAWIDTPSDRAQKAKMNYLEAYNEATALASNEEGKKRSNADAELVDKYNKAKRSKSLVQKHQEEVSSCSKKKKSKQEPVKEEWSGKHPWKPWDREKDLVAGRQSIKFDADNMDQGLSSRFSAGSFQRNFL
ncbi:hypothetical protein K2173_000853 [Erythroxylum novogranatense]|uniref:DUF3752 domain-containing protein n=1 Tax=Erythroxylum novogranatense TaxID=1862640 RepID=A0AAV8S7V9_9ROSI|nr:hypothetical protein K2173_000853 [Erythroxylum novogranatense]